MAIPVLTVSPDNRTNQEWHADLAKLATSLRAAQQERHRQAALRYVEAERKRRWAA
jgi:hypothetical protein